MNVGAVNGTTGSLKLKSLGAGTGDWKMVFDEAVVVDVSVAFGSRGVASDVSEPEIESESESEADSGSEGLSYHAH